MNRRAQALLTIIIVLLILTFYRDDYMSSQHPIPDTITETSTGQNLSLHGNVWNPPSIGKVRQPVVNRQPYKLPTPVSNKWIVVTSINYPSKDVKRLASLKGWNLVVVADRKTPPDWHYDNVHFLSMDYQQKLHFRLSVVSPENSYTRKNIGYLYAIKNGAEWIYDTDDDNKPYAKGLQQFEFKNFTAGLCYRKNTNGNNTMHKLFNPYRFFGNPGMWPRGFPLEHLKNHTNGKKRLCLCSSMRTPAVQQGLVHKDPDVDAIYRLLYADKETGLNERFNEFTPPIVLNSGTYSPWNSQNTLFHRNAFFTLFLPVSVAFRVTDIWRSYFAQKLLHLVGERIGFYPVNAIQFRNAHDYLADFEQEIDVYLKSGKFVDFLEEWQCYSNDIANCTVELAEQLGLLGFWQRKDGLLVKLWIDDLRSVGYKFPAMVAQKSDDNCWDSTGNKEVNCFPAHIELETDMPLRRSARALQRMKQKLEYAEDLHDWCRKAQPAGVFKSFSYQYLAGKHANHRALSINLGKVLVIAADLGGTGIGILQRMYQPYFAVLFFCGKGDFVTRARNESSMNTTNPLNFITLNEKVHHQTMIPECLVKVQQMKLQNVTGYYAMSESITLQMWIWHDPLKVVFPSMNVKPHQKLWTENNGTPPGEPVYKLITEKYKNDEDVQKMWKEYQRGLSANGDSRSAAEHIRSDTGHADASFIYIPSSKIDYFSQIIRIFYEANLPEGFAVAKFLDTVRVEWISHLANPLTSRENSYPTSLLVANPTRFPELSKLEERRTFCGSIVATFKRVLLDDW
ncbi:hypothetical protein Y032_0873g2804 [Ancylostoma ceylanicum]|uniref:Core-2/I-Branching enzyme n=1 Tax=Ancylostoma ceylanicum TaxID=53326 RepID=A0A016W9X2_9BILA|nr:hypothetical protein Y032_0873g2804 [Ancylostoma ceylanicum]